MIFLNGILLSFLITNFLKKVYINIWMDLGILEMLFFIHYQVIMYLNFFLNTLQIHQKLFHLKPKFQFFWENEDILYFLILSI